MEETPVIVRPARISLGAMAAKWYVFPLLTVLAFFLAHLHSLDRGPNGYHKWRESDSAMVAENFALFDMDFWHPRVNVVGEAGDGVVGMELPVYNYGVAALYKTFGFSHVWPRLVSLMAGLLGILGMWRLVYDLARDQRLASLACWVFAWSPLVSFYSHKIQPDVLGLSLSIWGVYGFIMWRKNQSPRWAILSALALAIAGGIKPTFLAVGLPMLWLYSHEDHPGKIWRVWKKPGLLLFGVVVLAIPALWMAHARNLTARFGEAYFYLGEDFTAELLGLLKPSFYQNVFLTWPIELAFGIPAFIAGLFALVHPKTRHLIPKIIVPWLIGAGIVIVLAAEHCATPHDYYYLVTMPPIAIIAAWGFASMLDTPRWRSVALVLLLIMPIFAHLRMVGRYDAVPDIHRLREKIAQVSRSTTPQPVKTSPWDPAGQTGPISGKLTLAVDDVPGFLLYMTGLRGYYLAPDGDLATLPFYQKRGVQWLLIKKRHLEANPVLSALLGQTLVEEDGIILAELKQP